MPHQGSIFNVDKTQIYMTNWQFQIVLDTPEAPLLAYYMSRALEYQIPSLGDQIKISGDPNTYIVTRFSPTPPNGITPDGTTQTIIYVQYENIDLRSNPNYDFIGISFDNIY